MADRDLIEIIARITARTVTDVSEIYRKERQDTPNSREDAAEDDSFGGIPFGTPFQDIAGFTKNVASFTRHMNTDTPKSSSRKDTQQST